MAIGQFPLMSDIKRRTIRAPTNPMDRSTIVSILPKRVEERKVTIQPSLFQIEPGSFERPSILVVGPASWWKEIDENQPLLEITHSSVVVADSVVKDYCNGIVGCDMDSHMPGLFYIPGEWTVEKILKEKQGELHIANVKQRNWFAHLVRLADAMWSRSNGNSVAIDDTMKLAARELNLMNKDWLKDSQTMELVRCKACGYLKNPAYPVCSNCKSIDNIEMAKELNLVFAK